VPLRAGPLALVFDEGQIRWVRCGAREVLRSIYVGVRDPQWNTVPGRIEDVLLDKEGDRFRVRFRMRHEQDPIRFAWDGEIEGGPSGELRFSMDGVAHATFAKNRIGICVLHPLECAGRPCQVDRVDGDQVSGVFPRFVSPRQPFLGIRGMRYAVAPGLFAEMDFEGDVFEMEDQRNWGDASFKTYSTPLALPLPAEVREGARISQSVTLRLVGEGRPRPVLVSPAAIARIEIDAARAFSLPARGLGCGSGETPLSEGDCRRLRAVRPDHLRFDLRPGGPGVQAALERAAAASSAIGAPLHLALFVGDDPGAELRELAEAAGRVRPPVSLWMLFRESTKTSSYGLAGEARSVLGAVRPEARFGGGTDGFFVDLNRQRPSAADLDQVSFALSPQAHLEDDATIFENLDALASVAESSRAFVGSCPLAVSPVTLRPRPAGRAVGGDDPRHKSLFGASWTAGLVAAACGAGVASLTFFEPTGPRGLIDAEGAFPLYHVLADIAEFDGGSALAASCSLPGVGVLALRREARLRTLVYNATAVPRRARVAGLERGGLVRRLDADSLAEAVGRPEEFRALSGDPLEPGRDGYAIDLGPYELARLDTVHTD
jgi:hypothetical protein